MEIGPLQKNKIEELYLFNHQVYPERKRYKEIIDFWFSKNPEEYGLTNILFVDGKIAGQSLHSSMKYYYEGKENDSFWGFDLIIEEEKRKDAYGIDLLQYNMERFDSEFATGSGPLALKIELALGFKQIGELKKYVNFVNPFFLPLTLLRSKKTVLKYPKKLKLSTEVEFERIEQDLLPDFIQPFNPNLLEISREKSFIKWRFYNTLHQYAVYKDVKSDAYFVLRTIVKNHILCMVLVDYRCDLNIPDEYENILRAAKKITRKLRIPILITGSSLKCIDEILEKNHFKVNGRNRPIISTLKFQNKKEDIKNRNFALITLADSDGEILW